MESWTCDTSDELPTEFRELLIQFSIAYLIERPECIIDYGIAYFERLHTERALRRKQEMLRHKHTDYGTSPSNFYEKSHMTKMCDVPEVESISLIDPLLSINSADDCETNTILATMKQVSIFRPMSNAILYEIIRRMTRQPVTSGEYIFREGDACDSCYFIKTGKFQMLCDEKPLKTFEDKGAFGELALLYAATRSYAVRATTDGELWHIDRRTFRSILFHHRTKYEELFNGIDLFRNLTADEKIKLADALVEREFHKGETLFEQGTEADGMYFIQEGQVKVCHKPDDPNETEEIELELEKGEVCGELGLFTGSRATSAYALEDVHTAFLEIKAFNRLIGAKIAMTGSNDIKWGNKLCTVIK